MEKNLKKNLYIYISLNNCAIHLKLRQHHKSTTLQFIQRLGPLLPQWISWLKNPPDSAGDSRGMGLIPGLGRSPGEGNSNVLQYSCLENPMGREAWRATVHGVTKSWT